jgi:hypothetical protein
MTNQIPNPAQVALPSDVLVKAQGRARSLGMSLSEYMRSLVDKDLAAADNDPWQEPIPKEVDERWEQDLAEIEEEEQQTGSPRKTYHNTDDYIQDMLDSS